MTRFRLIRAVKRPTGRGPGNGQYALQKALRARQVDWLTIDGALRDDEIPWYWCWLDRSAAVRSAAVGRPFVVGPNVLFENSRQPCRSRAERKICDAASCRLMFTESEWYRQLIENHRGENNRAPIVLWPYPIDPKPGGPLPPKHDLLIYAKSGYGESLIARLRRTYQRSVVISYGRYHRRALFEAARSSRACIYLSDDDRGPLALAEILLSGCPTVGLPLGAPFIQQGRTGIYVADWAVARCIDAIEDCQELDRVKVAALAAEQFDTERIVDTILLSLREVGPAVPAE